MVLLETLLEGLPQGVFWKDADLVYRGCNQRFAEMMGVASPAQVVGRNDLELNGDVVRTREIRRFDTRVLLENTSLTQTREIHFHDRGTANVSVTVHPLPSSSGIPDGILGIIEDRTEQVQSERMVAFATTHDPLTGLACRQTLERTLRQATQGPYSSTSQLALLVVDLHQFKKVNILHGPHIGDETLKEVANRLSCGLRKYDLVARMGEDCFGVLISDAGSDEDLYGVAEKVLYLIRTPFLVRGKEIRLKGNVGISRWKKDHNDADSMVQRAFMALEEAVRCSAGSFHLFRSEQDDRQRELLHIEQRLQGARERQDLSVWFQPQVDCRNGAIVGAEALLRWTDEVLGCVSPAEFIPLAEASGEIIPIGEWVLRQVCTQAVKWRQERLEPGRIWVNLSAKQIQEPFLVQVIRDVLAESGLPPGALGLEVTESTLVGNVDLAAQILQALKALGVKIAVDDFGTGYSSLSYLKHFPLDVLKIDRSFVRDLTGGRNGVMMARAIITMSHSLDLEVLAEGVEESTQEQLLFSMGCTHMQGYRFSRPVPAPEFTRLLEQRQVGRG